MKEIYLNLWHWFRVSVWIVGIPHVALLAFKGTESAIFTTTCLTAGWKCEYTQSDSTPSTTSVDPDALIAYDQGYKDGRKKQ